MGSGHLVTAVVVAMMLGSTSPAGADDPDKDKKSTHNLKQNTPQQDKAPAETSKGRNAGPAGGAQKIPGTGGAANAQTPLGTPPASTTPAANTLFDPKQDRPRGNTPPGTKVVTPESFKSKEEVAKELANPGMPAPESSGNPMKKALEGTGSDALRELPTTVAPGFGKNSSTTRQQQSEGTTPIPGNLGSVTTKKDGDTAVTTISGNNGFQATITANKDRVVGTTLDKKDNEATVHVTVDHTTNTMDTTVAFHAGKFAGQVWRQTNSGQWYRFATPNPENDTGDGRMPKGAAAVEIAKKSPAEVEAERRRQVTQPGDDQRRQLERVTMEVNAALKSAAANRTAGRVDENPVGDGAVGATGTAKAGTGKGCVQAGCPPNTGGPSKTGQ